MCNEHFSTQGTMPQRERITRERLETVGGDAVKAALLQVMRATGVRCEADLTCTYIPTGIEHIICRTNVKFMWCLSWSGITIQSDVEIRTDKAIYERLLSPPKTWLYILIVLVAPHAINERGGLQWMEECETIECQNLAMAQPVDEQFESCVIFDKGLRVEHLVLTRSHDHLMCVSASDLFNIQKLHVEKIWTETSRKRLHGRIAQTGIVELAKKRRQDYATAVVLARLAADKNVKDNLLTNPLQWHISMTSPLLLFWRVKSKSKWHERSRVISLRSLLKDLH